MDTTRISAAVDTARLGGSTVALVGAAGRPGWPGLWPAPESAGSS